jgi:adenosylcobinamide-GDP ribazoletransferase
MLAATQGKNLRRALMKTFLIRHRNGFLLALQFLTILPVGQLRVDDEDQLSLSVLYYPLVGAVIGVFLVACALLSEGLFSPLLAAVIIVALWLAITGALHMDGLADSADAWMGGLGSRSRTLALMKDPTCGPVAVATVVLVLLLKVAAIAQLLAFGTFFALLWVPVLARMSLLLLLLNTPYVRAGGLAESLLRQFSAPAAVAVCLLVSLLLLLNLATVGAWMMVCLAVVTVYLRQLMMQRLDGCTGDTLGAAAELAEVALLLVLVASVAN